jgi:glycosyltransferase involved in cell wall biosynthesis
MEAMLLSSYDEWLRLGYECDLVATAPTVGPLAPQLRERGYGVFHTPFRSRWRLLPRLGFILDFYRLCRSGYDVVHVHVEAGRPFFALLAKLAGVRQIAATPHNTFRFESSLRIRKFCERHLIQLLGGRFGMISDGVQTCEWDQYRIRGPRIWNWFDTSHFRPPSREERADARRSLEIKEDDFVLVSVGNCNSAKNHGALLRAIALLPAEVCPLYLHIGREEQDFPERRLASDLKIENHVRFLDSQQDPRPFLWAADLFAMPSRSEGLSIAALEAIAACAPALFSNVVGLADIAAVTRWTVLTTTAPESIAEGIVRIASMDLAERNERALVDSELVRDRFSPRNGVRSIAESLYAPRMIASQMPARVSGQSSQ